MTTMLSLILAFMLSIGGSPAASVNVNPAGCPGDTGIQAPDNNNRTINRFFEDYNQKTASRPISKKILEIPLIKQPKTQIRLRFSLCLKGKLRLMGYMDSMNMYQAFNMNPVNFTDPLGLDTDAGRIASSLSKYYESIRPKNPGPSWFDRLLGKIAGAGFRFIMDVDNIDAGHFTKRTLYDMGNLFTLGTLERTAAQKNLDIGDRVWFFLNEMPERIQNAGTFGLLDNLSAERGNGPEGAGRAVYKTIFDLSPASDIYTIFHTDAGIEDKIRAGGLFTSKIASLGLMMNLMNPSRASSSGYLSQSATKNFRTYNQLSDETFVHITTEWGAGKILEGGLNPEISGYVTKWKYVKNIDDPKVFNTKIYKQSLWGEASSKFDEGAYILSINPIEKPIYYSPFTNRVNGFPQWLFQGRTIDASRIRLIRIIPGGN